MCKVRLAIPLLIVVSGLLGGCQPPNAVTVQPLPEVPKGWSRIERPEVPFTFAAPNGWTFEAVEPDPLFGALSGNFMTQNAVIGTMESADKTASVLLIATYEPGSAANPEGIANELADIGGQAGMSSVQQGTIDLPVGKAYRAFIAIQDSGFVIATTCYAGRAKEGVYQFNFLVVGGDTVGYIPHEEIMKTVHFK